MKTPETILKSANGTKRLRAQAMATSAVNRCGIIFATLLCTGACTPAQAIDIQFDFTFDSSNFFNGNLQRQNVLNAAAQVFESRFTDTLSAITPGSGNTWTANFENPSTGLSQSVVNRTIATNAIVVYVGARDLPGNTLGFGGPGGFSASGSSPFLDAVAVRGQTGADANPPTDFGPWGGSVTFDSLAPWHFDQDVTTVESFGTASDFYSVAVHELAHLLGFGAAESWSTFVSGSTFTGPKSKALNSGVAIPLSGDLSHWAEGVTGDVLSPVVRIDQEAAMDPSITDGTRKYFTDLDYAGMDDIGWTVIPEPGACVLLISGLGAAVARRRRVTRAERPEKRVNRARAQFETDSPGSSTNARGYDAMPYETHFCFHGPRRLLLFDWLPERRRHDQSFREG